MKVQDNATPRTLAPPGNYYGVVVGIYDLGTQAGTGDFKDRHQCVISYELHSKKRGIIKDDSGHPVVVSKYYGVTFGKNSAGVPSALRTDSEAILGRTFTDAEAKEGINTDDLADRIVKVSVKHAEKKSGGAKEVLTLTALGEDDDYEPESESDTVTYDLSPGDPFPENVPKWIQTMCQRSLEWTAHAMKIPAKTARTSREPGDDDGDDEPY